jgi:hypothetical protein
VREVGQLPQPAWAKGEQDAEQSGVNTAQERVE